MILQYSMFKSSIWYEIVLFSVEMYFFQKLVCTFWWIDTVNQQVQITGFKKKYKNQQEIKSKRLWAHRKGEMSWLGTTKDDSAEQKNMDDPAESSSCPMHYYDPVVLIQVSLVILDLAQTNWKRGVTIGREKYFRSSLHFFVRPGQFFSSQVMTSPY
jgi:hypothetical protein